MMGKGNLFDWKRGGGFGGRHGCRTVASVQVATTTTLVLGAQLRRTATTKLTFQGEFITKYN
jgi:hypothetical protein